MYFYEVLWHIDHDNVIDDVFTEEFDTKEEAMDYYEQHKNDPGKYGWLVTKRNERLVPVETYVGYVEFYGDE